MTYIQSDIDHEYYLVRDVADKKMACNMLALIKKNINILINELYSKKDNEYKDYNQYINRLESRIMNTIISENSGRGKETSYSVNKGYELVLCLRSKKNWNTFHDPNLITYVVLHELSHIASPTYEPEYNNHGPVFKKIFSFLTIVAISKGLYQKIDFKNSAEEYCGIYITDSIV